MVMGVYYVMCGDLMIGGFVGFLVFVGVFYCLLEKIVVVIEIYLCGIVGFCCY